MEGEGFKRRKENDNNAANGRTLQEEIYWSNFKSMRFFQFLSGDFLTQLMIPRKFSENMREKLPQLVSLKGPGGATWDVQLDKGNNNTLYFRDGWEEFVKAHQFRENDLLMFKYKRHSCFKVWVFDGKDLCENAGSYFVRKSAIEEDAGCEKSQAKRTRGEASVVILNEEDESEYHNPCPKKGPAGSSRRGRKSIYGPVKPKDGSDSHGIFPCANRPSPTTEEKQSAEPRATKVSTPETLRIVLKASSVSQHFRLGIPAAWSSCNLPRKNQNLELCVDGKRWIVRYYPNPRSGGGLISSGWGSFARDNSLKEFDVCVFKLRSRKDDPLILDVSISRAGSQVVNHDTPHNLCFSG